MKKEHILRGAFIIVMLFILVGIILVFAAGSVEDSINEELPTVTTEKLYEFREDIIYSFSTTSEECKNKIAECQAYIAELGLLEVDAVIDEEIVRVENIIYTYENDLELLIEQEAELAKWAARKAEYPVATEVWLYMKDNFGWSDKVCAGIMGNMMAEIAGGTLNFNRWNIDKSSGYGMIQWIGSRRTGIKNRYGSAPSVEEQLLYMRDEMFGSNGVKQQITDRQLEAIMNGESPEQIAYDFARYFERCASFSYNRRRDYARIAYNYFVD